MFKLVDAWLVTARISSFLDWLDLAWLTIFDHFAFHWIFATLLVVIIETFFCVYFVVVHPCTKYMYSK